MRLPKEFRFDGTEVRIRRSGDSVVLEPVSDHWDWLREWREKFGPLDADFVSAVGEKMPELERPEVDQYFAEIEDQPEPGDP